MVYTFEQLLSILDANLNVERFCVIGSEKMFELMEKDMDRLLIDEEKVLLKLTYF